MNPAFTKEDLKLFSKYLKNSSVYFEYGSGGSTFLAYQQKNINKIISVESCQLWIDTIFKKLKTDINDSRINFNFISFTSNVANLGLPVFKNNSQVEILKNDNNLSPNQITDTILINGQILSSSMDSRKNILYNIKLENDIILSNVHPKIVIPKDNTILKKYIDYSGVINLYKNDNIDLILIDGRCRVSCALMCHKIISDECIVLIDDFKNRKCYQIIFKYYDVLEKGDRMMALKKKKNIHVSNNDIEIYIKDIR